MKTNLTICQRLLQAVGLAPIVLVSFVLSVGTTNAQETKSAPDSPDKAQTERVQVKDPESNSGPSSQSGVDREKMKKATVLLAAVGGIAVFGIGAIASIMLWARHLRRLARDLGPRQKTVGNDFWFLKPPKPNAAEPDITDSHRPPYTPPESETSE